MGGLTLRLRWRPACPALAVRQPQMRPSPPARHWAPVIALSLAVLAPHSTSVHPIAPLDLSAAAVFAPSEPTAQELAALEMVLLKHVRTRTNSSWGLASWIDGASGRAESGTTSAVRLVRWPEAAAQGCRCCAGQDNFSRPESFLLCTDQAAEASDDTAWVVAADQRGFLFGVGRLLRELRIEGNSVQVPPLHVRVEPKAEMRAHGLALPQDKANLEEFIKDLAAFGMNTISNAYPDAVAIASQLGLDVQVGTSPCPWVGDAPEKKCLASRAAQWRGLTKLDHVTMAGGDDGSVVLSPPQQMGTGKAFAQALHAVHPDAKLWISLQEYSATNFTLFMKLLREPGTETWLAGLFNGPVRFHPHSPAAPSLSRCCLNLTTVARTACAVLDGGAAPAHAPEHADAAVPGHLPPHQGPIPSAVDALGIRIHVRPIGHQSDPAPARRNRQAPSEGAVRPPTDRLLQLRE